MTEDSPRTKTQPRTKPQPRAIPPQRQRQLTSALVAALQRYSGHTQTTLAQATGISRGMIGFFQQGKSLPSSAQLQAIEQACGVSAEELLREIQGMVQEVETLIK